MRILHVLDHSVPLHSGYSFRTLAIFREQRKLGWDPIALTSTKHYGAAADVETIEDMRFYRTPVRIPSLRHVPILNQLAVIFDTESRLRALVPVLKPDILHAHSPCLNGLAAESIGRTLGIPVVYEMRASWEDAAVDHGTTTEGSWRYNLSRAMETRVLRNADAIITICDGLRIDIEARGLHASRVTVIPNGVDPEEFPVIVEPDRALKTSLGLNNSTVIGFIGSFYGYEGLELLIDALPQILTKDKSVMLLLVGGGIEEHALRGQAVRLGLQNRVIMPGRVPHADVARYYSIVDLLVFPRKSIRLTEAVTPLKPLEAMAQGRLVIASDVGGHRELIKPNETGFLFKANDASALAGAVTTALEHKDKWNAVRDAAHKFVINERRWQQIVAGYAQVYSNAARRTL